MVKGLLLGLLMILLLPSVSFAWGYGYSNYYRPYPYVYYRPYPYVYYRYYSYPYRYYSYGYYRPYRYGYGW